MGNKNVPPWLQEVETQVHEETENELPVFPSISKHELIRNVTHFHPYNVLWAIPQANPVCLLGFCPIL